MNDDDWGQFPPEQRRCERCGEWMPRTKKRSKAFGGRGRERRFCDDACRKAASRSRRAKQSTSRRRRATPQKID